ncbi:hypothetical protein VTN77DRAFT_9133 [Rasamsonia byssochlamydoides]|uniref:uncharacterized protein n=1 Tax=Rasamsonia byssochlamydoides TaxID=89139 RepID=UPI0037449C39
MPDHNHIIALPNTPPIDNPSINPLEIAQQWLSSLETVLRTQDFPRLRELFHTESWWRDALALQWDLRTIQGANRIEAFISQHQPQAQLSSFRLQDIGKYQPTLDEPEKDAGLQLSWVVSMFFFETRVGRGAGVLRLTQENGGSRQWKAYTVYTSLQELKGFEEPLGPKRVYGTLGSMPGGSSKGTWLERRKKQLEFADEEPTVLVVGAGQSGLNIGARLQFLGVSTLIIDKNERIGDNWRKRYRTLVTHDPAEFTHMAYLPFPKNWPQFTPKDKLADWFEAYASLMELNVWTKTSITGAVYDDAAGTWTVTLSRADGFQRVLHPRHLVWCTGHSGEPKIPTFPGQEDFRGVVYHGSQHEDASKYDVRGKKVIVVGTGNSGHDIAENFYENGAEVTMLQRSGTYVLSLDKGVFMLHEGVHDEWGPPTDQADIISESLPFPVQFALNVYLTRRISAVDAPLLSGLKRSGFKIYKGVDNSGIARLYFTRGGGYYIDVGCSQLIIDGKIKVKHSPKGIAGFKTHALVLNDEQQTELEADIVVLATGYDNMRTTVRKVLGDRVADRVGDVWDLDEEGELNAIWRPSGHPHFWYMGGNLALCRIYSKFLALQIKAIEEGLAPSSPSSAAATAAESEL